MVKKNKNELWRIWVLEDGIWTPILRAYNTKGITSGVAKRNCIWNRLCKIKIVRYVAEDEYDLEDC